MKHGGRLKKLEKHFGDLEPTIVHVIDIYGNDSFYHWGTGEPATAEEIERFDSMPDDKKYTINPAPLPEDAYPDDEIDRVLPDVEKP